MDTRISLTFKCCFQINCLAYLISTFISISLHHLLITFCTCPSGVNFAWTIFHGLKLSYNADTDTAGLQGLSSDSQLVNVLITIDGNTGCSFCAMKIVGLLGREFKNDLYNVSLKSLLQI